MLIESGAGPLVGREPELEQLETVLDGLARGISGCVALEGEPGIGKTRLLAELQRRAEDRGFLVLAGVAAEFERDLPFSVWIDALDAYVSSQELGLNDLWEPDLVDELAGVLPCVGGSDDGTGHSIADERYRAHRAVRRLLELLARSRPLALVLDDLHWSDGASIELLAALVRRGADAPVLLALGFRSGQLARPLSAALAVPSVRTLTLKPLSETQAGELLGELDPRSVAAIYDHGGGNPFYLEQLARAHGEGSLIATAETNWGGGVPAAVAASLAVEVDSLSAAERALLEAAAVAGEPFEPDLAAAIAGLPADEGLVALDALLGVDLIRPTPVPRRFAFRHPLVRRTVYESTRGGWRLAAHAKAATELTRRGATAAERAHHVEQAASPGDEQAIALLLQAGAESAPRAPSAAARWFQAALRLVPGADRKRQVDVRVALAGALRSLGELDRCRATLLEAIDLLAPEARAQRVELTARCAAVEHWLGRHEDAHRHLNDAWAELSDHSTAAAAALQIELAIDGLYERDFAQTLAMGRAALRTAQSIGDRALIAAAASALCLGETVAGNVAPARRHREEALAQLERLSDAELAPRLEALYYLGWAENYLEHYDAAIVHVDRGIAISRATGEGRLLVPMMLVKPYTFEVQGRMAEAVELCETVVEATRLSASPHDLFWALFELAYAHYYSGELDAAITAGEESARVGGRLAGGTMPAAGGGPGWVLGMAHFENGNVEKAWQIMRALGGDDLAHKIPVERCFDWEVLALVEIARGHQEAADGYARRAEEHAATLGLRVQTALALRTRAAVLLARGEPVAAARLATESADLAAAAGARHQAAYSLALAGRALAAAGDRGRAIAVLREAESELDACGSPRVRDEMRRELRRLGARAEPRGPASADDSGVGALTKRELEIAGLVTDRKTNREIASALFLSEKTIESHLRNIFVKLGSSTRVEVARTIARDPQGRSGTGRV